MPSKEEKLAYIEKLKLRIKELKVKIADHEREDNKRNYGFYVKGAELYRELALHKGEILMNRRIIKSEDGE